MEHTLFEDQSPIDARPPAYVWLTRSVIVGVIVGIVSAVQVVYAGVHFF
jgi:hypothetical protein